GGGSPFHVGADRRRCARDLDMRDREGGALPEERVEAHCDGEEAETDDDRAERRREPAQVRGRRPSCPRARERHSAGARRPTLRTTTLPGHAPSFAASRSVPTSERRQLELAEE